MKDIKSFVVGFLTAVIILMSLGFKEEARGSVSWKPLFVKIVK